jgi:H+/Cl- antiporter ClcA
VNAEPGPALPAPAIGERVFWVLTGLAVALGVLGGLAGLVFLRFVTIGSHWYTAASPGWFGGHWWWALVTTAAGVVVGALRRLTRLPEDVPGLVEDLRAGYVDPTLVPGTVAVSLASLIGGASVGPEKVLASIGGGAGGWLARRRYLAGEDAHVSTLAGIAGIYGGLFSSPVIVVMLVLELARPGGRRFSKVLVANIVAASVSFGIYFAVAGAVFLGVYQVPPYTFEDWQLLAAVPLGVFAAGVTTFTTGVIVMVSRSFERLHLPTVARCALGGAVFGVIGVALPLTMFAGGDQLASVLTGAGSLGLGLCLATLVAKALTVAVSRATGFLGGPIFPAIFIGGTAGVVVHLALPEIPLGLAFSCLLPAVLGTLVAAPFAMVLLAAFMTQVGPLQTPPILIAVVSAYLAVEALRHWGVAVQEPDKTGGGTLRQNP